MNEPKRRFFSGDTLQQALVQAANYFNIDPQEIAYRSIEKKHGFIRVRRKVVIEVDPDAPRRQASAVPPAPPAAPVGPDAAPPRPATAPPPGAIPAGAIPVGLSESRPPREARAPREDRGPRRDDRDRGGRGDRGPRAARGEHGDRGGRGRGGERRGDRGGERSRGEGRLRPSGEPRREREPRAAVAAPGAAVSGGGLVPLPETPRRPSERYPLASGPQAEAASRAMDLLLRISGLELEARILQGEERIEVDLTGADADWCFSEEGELLAAFEHLLPRMIRSLSGETPLVRVDCDNFHEIREERLRSMAQRIADDVRRLGRPRTLEPMNPADRRIVHLTLSDDPGVVTESEGEGYFKRITVRPA